MSVRLGHENHRIFLRGVIYARISKDKADSLGAHKSTDIQVGNCTTKVAEPEGITIVATLVDDDISAWNRKKVRPGYKRLLKMIEHNEVDVVIAWHTDRLWRQPRELEGYIDAVGEHGVQTRTVTAGRFDLSDAYGRRMARQFVNDAAYESDHRSERVREATFVGARDGKHHGGIRCFGYEGGKMRLDDDGKPIGGGYSIVPSEAMEVIGMVDAVIAGQSIRSIATDLNKRAVSTVTGRAPWKSANVRDLILSPRIAGYSEHKGVIVGDGLWKPLVERRKWEMARAILMDPARRTNHLGPAPRYLGTGIYRCSICNIPMRAGRAGNALVPSYRCAKGNSSTPHTTIPGAHVTRRCAAVDEFVRDAILDALQTRPVNTVRPAAGVPADAATLRIKQATIEPLLRQAMADLMAGKIDAVELARRTEEIKKDADDYTAGLAELPEFDEAEAIVSKAKSLDVDWWENVLDLDQRRLIVDRFVEVTIMPLPRGSKGFNPEGVRVIGKPRP